MQPKQEIKILTKECTEDLFNFDTSGGGNKKSPNQEPVDNCFFPNSNSTKKDEFNLFSELSSSSTKEKEKEKNDGGSDFDFGFQTKDDKLSQLISKMNVVGSQNNTVSTNPNDLLFQSLNSGNNNFMLNQNVQQIGGYHHPSNSGMYNNYQLQQNSYFDNKIHSNLGSYNTGMYQNTPHINIHQPNINVQNTFYNSFNLGAPVNTTIQPKNETKIKLNYGLEFSNTDKSNIMDKSRTNPSSQSSNDLYSSLYSKNDLNSGNKTTKNNKDPFSHLLNMK